MCLSPQPWPAPTRPTFFSWHSLTSLPNVLHCPSARLPAVTFLLTHFNKRRALQLAEALLKCELREA